MAAGVADGGLDFLEGDNLDSKLRASRGQLSIKRSSTVKKTKRRTLARDSSKPRPSAKGALNRPLVDNADSSWRQLSGRTHTYLFCVRALHSTAALSYCDIKVKCRDFCSLNVLYVCISNSH